MTPSAGAPQTVFRLFVPARLLRPEPGAELEVVPQWPRGTPRSCGEPWTTPRGRRRGASVVFTFDPRRFGTRGRWCRGLWRVTIIGKRVVDDDDGTGRGGVFDDELVRSSFRVR